MNNPGRPKLKSLAHLVREVDSAPDMESALRVIVERAREIMAADVCTVYFTEHERQRHVIVATDGLSPTLIGRIQFGFGEGIIGRVAECAKPVNLDRIPEELDQGFVHQSGAGRFQGFLGVPITHRSKVQGVLVVRQRKARRFGDADAAFLSTLATQLGGAIAYARASGELCNLCRGHYVESRLLEGQPGAPGTTIGTGFVVFPTADLSAAPNRVPEDPSIEEQRLREAVSFVQEEVKKLSADLDGTLSDADRTLFDAYALILDSPEIVDATVTRIHQGNWAPGALRQTIAMYTQRFAEMEDPYLQERGTDILQLGNRIFAHLQGTQGTANDYPPNTILIGRQITAIDLGLAPTERLRGIVSAEGSSLSHAAILASSLGIPAVMGVRNAPLEHLDGQEIVVDGTQGRVYLCPSAHLRKEVERQIRDQQAFEKDLESFANQPSKTKDGVEVHLYTNAGLISDIRSMAISGSAGIGLFRTELPFMLYDRFPSEQEQVKLYRQVLETLAPRPVNLRTLDAGGDKPLPYLPVEEHNPALGWRGIRLALDHPDVFLTQIRAALRANAGIGNLKLLLPMVNSISEVDQALALIERAVGQLSVEGIATSRPPVGIMIEIPSAVYQALELARRVDFLSVGTNDLAQYLLAIDRDNPQVSERLDPLHPAVLRALSYVVNACTRAGKPAAVCGEMAGDPGYALLLLGLGFNSLSVSAAALPRVKWAVSCVSLARMKSLARQALTQERPELIRQLLEKALDGAGMSHPLHRAKAYTVNGTVPGPEQSAKP